MDLNDLARAGKLPADPSIGAKPMTRPLDIAKELAVAVREPHPHAPGGALDGEPANDEKPTPPKWQSPADTVRGLLAVRPRLATGIAPLDRILRGGFRQGTRAVIGGAPGASKTSLVAKMSHDWLRAGVPVFFLAADEDRDLILVRFGQHIGISRNRLDSDSPDPEAVEELAAHLAALPFECIDPDEPGSTLEGVARELRRRYPTGTAVLVADSLQRARCDASVLCDSETARVEAMMEASKAVSKMGITLIALSELNRGAYRSRDARQNVSGMASGKHSGSIEYVARVLVNLDTAKDDVIKMTVAKPTGYDEDVIALRFDREACSFEVTDLPTDDDAGGPDATADRFFEDVQRVDALLRRGTKFKSQGAIGKAIKMKKATVGRVMAYLEADAELVTKNEKGFYQHSHAPLPGSQTGERH